MAYKMNQLTRYRCIDCGEGRRMRYVGDRLKCEGCGHTIPYKNGRGITEARP